MKKKLKETERNTTIIWAIGMIIGLLGAFLIKPYTYVGASVMMIGVIVILASAVYSFINNRCPHCGRFLYRVSGEFCPFCGKKLYE